LLQGTFTYGSCLAGYSGREGSRLVALNFY
jgi:hypothetical protein